ncbi:hypothetical protein PVAG01_02266 [Phlyctema vagabunda]|uniref:Uncharacterized protein n=1 Tax=Phlyctema vagabunda TaxID=108571 RepID=A0ABR4PQ87_9HELO
MAAMASPSRMPYIASLAVLLLIWTVWYLEVPSIKSAIQNQAGLNSNVAEQPQGQDGVSEVDIITANTTVAVETVSNRPLILYAYAESETARENLQFFLRHGIHAAADFIFIMNGRTDAAKLVPVNEENIRVIRRPNDCYDIGAYAEVLTKNDLYKNYTRFITLNASLRGPFLPYWSESCWSDMYLNRVTDQVKLVGMTANCWPKFHIQSMIWATDRVGMEVLLFPPKAATAHLAPAVYFPDDDEIDESHIPPGINTCFHTWKQAVHAEISATALIKAAGYGVDAMMSRLHKTEDYEATCGGKENGDVLWDSKYEGTNVHPYETIFQKSNRDIDPVGLERLTDWTDGSKYSSYDFCKA